MLTSLQRFVLETDHIEIYTLWPTWKCSSCPWIPPSLLMISQPHLPVVKHFSFYCYKRPTQTGSCTAANPHTLAFCTYFKLLLPQPSLLKSRSREISSICPVSMSESHFGLNCKGPVRKTSQKASQAFYLISGKKNHQRVHQKESSTLGGGQEVQDGKKLHWFRPAQWVKGEKPHYWWSSVSPLSPVPKLVSTGFSIGNIHKASSIKVPENHIFPDSLY